MPVTAMRAPTQQGQRNIMGLDIYSNTRLIRLVAILRGVTPDQAMKVAEVLCEAGIRAIEVTFNTDGAAKIITALGKRFANDMAIGAGTVTNLEQLSSAIDAGASFILSPDCQTDVIRGTKHAGLFSIPGAMTPTEIQNAVRAGADMVKLFPAGNLGVGYMKSVLAPLNDAKLMVVGGVDQTNIAQFFEAGAVAAGVGSCLVNKSEVTAGDYAKLKVRAAEFARLAL